MIFSCKFPPSSQCLREWENGIARGRKMDVVQKISRPPIAIILLEPVIFRAASAPADSNHLRTISLKPLHFHGNFGIPFRHMTQVLSRHISSRYFELFRPYFLQNLHISNPYQNKPFQASNKKYSKNKPKRPDVFNNANCDTQGIKFQH